VPICFVARRATKYIARRKFLLSSGKDWRAAGWISVGVGHIDTQTGPIIEHRYKPSQGAAVRRTNRNRLQMSLEGAHALRNGFGPGKPPAPSRVFSQSPAAALGHARPLRVHLGRHGPDACVVGCPEQPTTLGGREGTPDLRD
jgi:hypothetical protein